MNPTLPNQKILAAGWSLTRLARHIGAALESVSRNCNGHRHTPWIQESVAKVLGLEPREVWGEWYWLDIERRKRGVA